MSLLDVNVLVGAHRLGSPRHKEYARYIESLATSVENFSVPTVVRSGFLRIVTNHRIFAVPTPLDLALQFLDSLLERENYTDMEPGERHWQLFAGLCRKIEAKGNDIPDAYLAALALEKGTELMTADRGFARFPGLKWKHPLDDRS
jgi:toxin-antitoxin system PIN domain toxin